MVGSPETRGESEKPAPSAAFVGAAAQLGQPEGRGTEGATPTPGRRPPLGAAGYGPSGSPPPLRWGKGDQAPSLELRGQGPPALVPGLSACSQVPPLPGGASTPGGCEVGEWVCLRAARGMVRGFGEAPAGVTWADSTLHPGLHLCGRPEQGAEARSGALTTILCASAVLLSWARKQSQ